MFGNDSLKGILCSRVRVFVCFCLFVFEFFCLFVFFCFVFFLQTVFCLNKTLSERLRQTLLSNMTSNVFGFILLHYFMISYIFSIISDEI